MLVLDIDSLNEQDCFSPAQGGAALTVTSTGGICFILVIAIYLLDEKDKRVKGTET